MSLAELAARVPECVVAAWVDARTGEVLEQQWGREPAREPAAGDQLHAVIEVVRSPERPRHTVLLSRDRVYIARRRRQQDRLVLVVICERSPNLGLAVALVNAAADTEARP